MPPQYCGRPSPGYKSLVHGDWDTVDDRGQTIGISQTRNGGPRDATCEDIPAHNLGKRYPGRVRGSKQRLPPDTDEVIPPMPHDLSALKERPTFSKEEQDVPTVDGGSSTTNGNNGTGTFGKQLGRMDTSAGSFKDSAVYKYLGVPARPTTIMIPAIGVPEEEQGEQFCCFHLLSPWTVMKLRGAKATALSLTPGFVD